MKRPFGDLSSHGHGKRSGRRGATRPEQPSSETTEVREWRREDAWRASAALDRIAARFSHGDEMLEMP
jgi:hypothetical protein